MNIYFLAGCLVLATALYAQTSDRRRRGLFHLERRADASSRFPRGDVRHLRPRHDFNQPTPTRVGAGRPVRMPSFTNVYVNPSSYRAFMKTGQWPDRPCHPRGSGVRRAKGPSIKEGTSIESRRHRSVGEGRSTLSRKWAFCRFRARHKTQVAALPRTERCYACHSDNVAVDNTFVQFYRRCSRWPRIWVL